MGFLVTGQEDKCLIFIYFWPHAPFDKFHREVYATFCAEHFPQQATFLFDPLCFRREGEGRHSACLCVCVCMTLSNHSSALNCFLCKAHQKVNLAK